MKKQQTTSAENAVMRCRIILCNSPRLLLKTIADALIFFCTFNGSSQRSVYISYINILNQAKRWQGTTKMLITSNQNILSNKLSFIILFLFYFLEWQKRIATWWLCRIHMCTSTQFSCHVMHSSNDSPIQVPHNELSMGQKKCKKWNKNEWQFQTNTTGKYRKK